MVGSRILTRSPNQNDYNTDDKVTAHDSQQFLLNFFTVFNQFQSNQFFVSGESYAGVYVPTLAQQVVLGNQQQNTPLINIKGILVGNGVTDQEFDGNAFPPFVHGHALIPDTLWVQLEAACGNSKFSFKVNNEKTIGTLLETVLISLVTPPTWWLISMFTISMPTATKATTQLNEECNPCSGSMHLNE